MKAMSIRQAARWAERNDCVYRANKFTGAPDYMTAAVDQRTNLVLCMGWGNKAYDYKAQHADQQIRVYTLAEVLEGIDEEEGEMSCAPGARDADAPWN